MLTTNDSDSTDLVGWLGRLRLSLGLAMKFDDLDLLLSGKDSMRDASEASQCRLLLTRPYNLRTCE